ncbi:alpha/beta hydrolase [Actinokineospora sp. NBRC 105648]|uniref:alpha/beta hydrolase n=1 Tax=Actinokineospora sp. NBRC 105648 TaxID=3032206 RepID=UPI0024A30E39|nr:alpha/beta hydrolase [Actinokineospora sp. NBRC 105648]GLZ38911.1 esterase [Actinokineospora sp. NBRC 105648]
MAHDLDPELAAWAATIPRLDYTDLAGARARLRAIAGAQPAYPRAAHVAVADHTATAEDGTVVPLRVYRPAGVPGALPCLLYLHWGGFVFGDLETVHATAQQVADVVGVVVVNVAYRLAPEHPFPAALLDCHAALRWAVEHATELGIDPARVGVGGESAGGGLAAALALRARDEGGPPLRFQCLVYPALDDRLVTESARRFVDTPKWDRASAELTWRYYLGDLDPVPAHAAPARAADLSGLPAAFVSVCEFDPLRDEGALYARRLAEAGTSAELHVYSGTFHASISHTGAAVSRRMIREQLSAIRRSLVE